MPSELLHGRYRRYKEDTSVFTTWLHCAAEACGYKAWTSSQLDDNPTHITPNHVSETPSHLFQGRVHSPAESSSQSQKPAITAVKHKVSISELLRQAETVVNHTTKGLILPEVILNALKRAIAARQSSADWYARAGIQNESDKRHLHFIDTLRTILDLLSRNFSTEEPCRKGARPSKKQQRHIVQLRNMFEALEVEDADEEHPLTAQDLSILSQSSGFSNQGMVVYELEDNDPYLADAFALYCFFEDLHAIQERLKQIWQKFKAGKATLVAATIMTHTAINAVKRLEEAVTARKKPKMSKKGSYFSLALPMFYADAVSQGKDPREILTTGKTLGVRPFDDFIYLPTARILLKFADIGPRLEEKGWPVPVPQIRSSYMGRLDLLEPLEYAELEAKDRILTQLFHDFALISLLAHGSGHKSNSLYQNNQLPEADDDFAQIAQELLSKGEVSAHAVFASQVLLDILDICGDQSPAFYETLLEQGKISEHVLTSRVNEDGSWDLTQDTWCLEDHQVIDDSWFLIKEHIQAPTFPSIKQRFLQFGHEAQFEIEVTIRKSVVATVKRSLNLDRAESGERPNPDAKEKILGPIHPSPDANFAMTHNPLYCGTLALRLLTNMEESGVALANNVHTVFSTAHVYNALRQLHLLDVPSPELEHVINVHKVAIFANDIPLTPVDMFRRMAYRLGVVGNKKRFLRKLPCNLATKNPSACLRLLAGNAKCRESAVLQLEDEVMAHADQSKKTLANVAPRKRSCQLSPVQLLDGLETYLSEVLEDIGIDYLTLARSCKHFLKQLRKSICEKVNVEYPIVKDPDGFEQCRYHYMVLSILEKSWQRMHILNRRETKQPAEAHPELLIARDVFQSLFGPKRK